MTRAPSIAAAAGVLGVVSVALAGLLWLTPGDVDDGVREAGPATARESRTDTDPRADTTGSLAEAPAPAETAPEAVAEVEPAAPAPDVAAAPAEPPIEGLLLTRDGDTVILAGTVADPAIRAGVVEAARSRFVSQPIVDRLTVAETAQALPAEVAGVALSALARLAEGEARLAAGALSIEGRALYAQAATRIAEEIGARLPQDWTTSLAIATPDPRPEPIVAALPAEAPAPTPATEQTTAETFSEAETSASTTEPAASSSAPASALGFVTDPSRPLPATLAQIDRHPLPPRR